LSEEERMDLVARLRAIEHVLSFALASNYLLAKLPDDKVDFLHKTALATLTTAAPFQTNDPAISDHLSAQLVEHVEGMLAVAKNLLAEGRKRAQQDD
jgi:hypothetical protein